MLIFPFTAALASSSEGPADLTASLYGIIALIVFVLAYSLVIGEEFLHLRKSKPVLVAAGIIWILVGMAYNGIGEPYAAGIAVKHNIEEYAELLLFLLAAMTYINALEERNVFDALRGWLVSKGFSLKTVFQSQIDHIVIVKLAQAGLLGAVEKYASGGNRTVVTNFIFCEDLKGRSLIAGKICAPKPGC